MARYVRNIYAKNYQNLVIDFQVTVKNVGDVFLRHSVLFIHVILVRLTLAIKITYLLTYLLN